MKCYKCKNEIPSLNINIQTDVAQCPACNEIFKISEHLLSESPSEKNFDINSTPKNTWYKKESRNIIIGASTRSSIAFFLVPFMLVWSGGALGGIYGTQIYNGKFDLVLSLFGIPFVLGSLLFWGITLMAIWGKVELTLDNKGGEIFTGLRKIGKTKKFTWDEISSVKESTNTTKISSRQISNITLEGKKRITFGTGLSYGKKYYLLNALKQLVSQQKNRRSIF